MLDPRFFSLDAVSVEDKDGKPCFKLASPRRKRKAEAERSPRSPKAEPVPCNVLDNITVRATNSGEIVFSKHKRKWAECVKGGNQEDDETRKRRSRCGECEGCLRKDCGNCSHCLDMEKFGGSGNLRQACIRRRCLTMRADTPKAKDVWNHACDACGEGGELLCCDNCVVTFHMRCLDPPLTNVPPGKWLCPACSHNAVCDVCNLGGELLCCDSCPRV